MNAPFLVPLGKDRNSYTRFTSQSLIKEEQKMFEDALNMKKSGMRVPIKNKFFADLTKEQKYALTTVIRTSSIECITGLPGTGKSHLSRALRKIYEDAGYPVRGMALAGKMVDAMHVEAGIQEVNTIASRLAAWNKDKELPKKNEVLLLDEASMVGTRQMACILSHYRQVQGKVILFGDINQLQPIEAGAAFRGIIHRVGQTCLKNVQRQKEHWQCRASVYWGNRAIRQALNAYAVHHCLHASKDTQKVLTDLTEHYFQQRSKTPHDSIIVMASRRMEVDIFNYFIREKLKNNNELSQEYLITTQQRVEKKNGFPGEWSIREEDKAFAVGEQIIFTKNDYSLGVKNGELGKITQIRDHVITVQRNKKPTLTFHANDYGYLDYAYALTIYKMQGETVDHSLVFLTHSTDYFAANVACTRHRQSLSVHYSAKGFTCIDHIERHLSNIKDKPLLYEEMEFAKFRGFTPKPRSELSYSHEEQTTLYAQSLQILNQRFKQHEQLIDHQYGKEIALKKQEIDHHMQCAPHYPHGIKQWFGGTKRYQKEKNIWKKHHDTLDLQLKTMHQYCQLKTEQLSQRKMQEREQLVNQASWRLGIEKTHFDWDMSALMITMREQKHKMAEKAVRLSIEKLYSLPESKYYSWVSFTAEDLFKNLVNVKINDLTIQQFKKDLLSQFVQCKTTEDKCNILHDCSQKTANLFKNTDQRKKLAAYYPLVHGILSEIQFVYDFTYQGAHQHLKKNAPKTYNVLQLISNTLRDPLKIKSIEFLPTKFYKEQHLYREYLGKSMMLLTHLTKQVQNSKKFEFEKRYDKRLARSR